MVAVVADARIRGRAIVTLLGGLLALGACGAPEPGTPGVAASTGASSATGLTTRSAGPVGSPAGPVESPAGSGVGESSVFAESPGDPTSAPSTSTPGPSPSTPVHPASTSAVGTTEPDRSTGTVTPVATTGPSWPDVGLAGVNDPGCRSATPPVLLLHGSFSSVASNFPTIARALIASGRCVYGIDYGHEGTDAIQDSAAQVAAFARQVLGHAHQDRLDVVGYSQGGLVLRTALRLDGIADDVRVAALIAPSFHGTTSPLAAIVPTQLCPACADQIAGSALLRQLDAGGDLDGTVRYAVLSTRNDTIVTPVSSQVPIGPADRVRSTLVEDVCPTTQTDHLALPALPGLPGWVVAALDTDGRPATDALTCG
jgi:triacylglycerol lipase